MNLYGYKLHKRRMKSTIETLINRLKSERKKPSNKKDRGYILHLEEKIKKLHDNLKSCSAKIRELKRKKIESKQKSKRR